MTPLGTPRSKSMPRSYSAAVIARTANVYGQSGDGDSKRSLAQAHAAARLRAGGGRVTRFPEPLAPRLAKSFSAGVGDLTGETQGASAIPWRRDARCDPSSRFFADPDVTLEGV